MGGRDQEVRRPGGVNPDGPYAEAGFRFALARAPE